MGFSSYFLPIHNCPWTIVQIFFGGFIQPPLDVCTTVVVSFLVFDDGEAFFLAFVFSTSPNC